MTSSEWAMRIRCSDCGHGEDIRGGAVYVPYETVSVYLCPECGCRKWDDPRPGRLTFAAVWWNPWTWFRTRWEWRDQDARALPIDGIRLLPGGKGPMIAPTLKQMRLAATPGELAE